MDGSQLTSTQRGAVDQWLDQVLGLSLSEARELLEGCDDGQVREEVLSLFSYSDDDPSSPAGLLSRGALEFSANLLQKLSPGLDSGEDWTGRILGNYRLAEELGRGGMGVVYRGERVAGDLEHQVAIKVLSCYQGGQSGLERFLQERQILARLDHPGIARFIDVGYAESGRPFLVLELVEGQPIDAFCGEQNLNAREIVELVLEVCGAIDHAHQRMVIHRDIKPGNLLVCAGQRTSLSSAPSTQRVKLLDFGIAKLIEDAAGAGDLTQHAQPLTPNYASPEQILGESISAATDVYALGTLLYELIAGALPVDRTRLTPEELIASAHTDTQEPPSRRRHRRGLGAGRVGKVPGDLDAIVLKAIRTDPGDRYPSVRELSLDLEAFLDGRPVAARRGNRRYKIARFLTRNRMAVTVVATVIALLVGGIIVLVEQVQRADRERRSAEEIAEFALGVLTMGDIDEGYGSDFSARDLLDHAAVKLSERTGVAPVTLYKLERAIANGYGNLRDWDKAAEILEGLLQEGPGLKDKQARAESLLDLAQTFAERRLAEPALRLVDEATALLIELEGPNSVAVAEALANRVYFRWLVGPAPGTDPWRAVQDGHRALTIFRDKIGPDSEQEGGLLHYLAAHVGSSLEAGLATAEQLAELGMCSSSMGCLRGALRIRRQHDDPVASARTMNDLALLLDQQGEVSEATLLLENSLTVHREHLGAAHPNTMSIKANLAAMYRDAERYEESQAAYLEVLQLLDQTGPPTDPEVATYWWGLGLAELGLGHPDTAIGWWKKAADQDGYRVPRRAWVSLSLGRLLVEQGQPGQGEKRILAAFEMIANAFGQSDSRTQKYAGFVAQFYQDQGRAEAAARFEKLASQSE